MNKFVILLSTIFCCYTVNADIAIVVGKDSSIGSTATDEIQRVFLGKSNSINGTKVNPINQVENNTITETFNSTLLNKSSSQLKAYWSKLVFTGKGEPPQEAASDSEVINAVTKDPAAVGYIDSSAVTDKVKVIATIK